MIHHRKFFELIPLSKTFWQAKLLIILTATSLLLVAPPAMAHHAMGGKMPSKVLEGFLSGLAHPLIGVDHFAFIVAIGLLAAIKRQGLLILIAFNSSAMLGTGLHLLGLNLPGVELLVSSSILIFGVLLVQKNDLKTAPVIGLSVIAGICHGYAYGEAIFGAQMIPVLAYLVGFTCIQLGVAAIAFKLGKQLHQQNVQQQFPSLRSAGLIICGVGMAFLASQLVDALILVPKG